jgi:hypothetical protein
MRRFLPAFSCLHRSPVGRYSAPFFCAFHALAVDDGGGGAGLSPELFAALHIKRMMDILQRAVVSPQVEIIVERALRRKILGRIAPLAPRAQHVHDPIHNFAHIHLALAAPMFGRGNQRPEMPPFFIRQVARITPYVPIVFRAVFGRPHRRPLLESGRHP